VAKKESMADLLRIARDFREITPGTVKEMKAGVKAGTFSSRYNPNNVSTFMAPVSDSPSGHGKVSKAHLAMGRKACPICFEPHSLAAHKSHGVTSFARTHGAGATVEEMTERNVKKMAKAIKKVATAKPKKAAKKAAKKASKE